MKVTFADYLMYWHHLERDSSYRRILEMAGIPLDAELRVYEQAAIGECIPVVTDGYAVLGTEEDEAILKDGKVVVDFENCRFYTIVRIVGQKKPWVVRHGEDPGMTNATNVANAEPWLQTWIEEMLRDGAVETTDDYWKDKEDD